ncbi:30S ribosomal protein S21 [Patescibacteria group bacterium]|nr:30S ribosomal protein S21 [Patescibacteria group bacterium]MCL5409489.1 30S ribosomal protein S21 [Patescibacteria group bacterium]
MSIIVKRGVNDTNDSVIRKFQKRIISENVIQEYRDLEYHKTASEKRQEKRAEKQRKIMRYRNHNS